MSSYYPVGSIYYGGVSSWYPTMSVWTTDNTAVGTSVITGVPFFSGWLGGADPTTLQMRYPQSEPELDTEDCRNLTKGKQTLVERETSRNNSLRKNLEPVKCKHSGDCKGCVKMPEDPRLCYNYEKKNASAKEEAEEEGENARLKGMLDTLEEKK